MDADVAIIDQKERYRRQAALCYELAKTMDGERAESMVRLGDAYSDLAETPGTFREHIFTGVIAGPSKADMQLGAGCL